MSEYVPEEKEYNQADAEQAFQKEEYALASYVYCELWNGSRNNAYYFSKLGQSLRKKGDSKKFIELCSEVRTNNKLMNNEYVVSTICWCLYDCDIKDYTVEDKERYNQFLKSAKYIISKGHQKEAHEYYMNPYVLTILKVVKILKKKTSPPYRKIIEWLSYLDHNKLSDEHFEFTDDNGKDREIASPKEFYHYMMAKACEKTMQYERCIEACELGLSKVTKLHYKNHIWLKARMYYCKCMIEDDNSSAIEEYRKIADKEKHWFMHHKLSDIYFRNGDIKNALLYASKAFDGRFEKEKMVSLMQDTAVLWQANDEINNAKVFYQGSAYYRNLHSWTKNEELEYAISEMGINIDERPNIELMKKISKDYIESIIGKAVWEIGKIHHINSKRGFGFIIPNQGDENIHFRLKCIISNDYLKKDDVVEYQKSKNNETQALRVRKKR